MLIEGRRLVGLVAAAMVVLAALFARSADTPVSRAGPSANDWPFSEFVLAPPSPPVLSPSPWATAPRPIGFGPPVDTGALAAVVMDEASGAVLYGKNAHEPLPPASLTKIATAVLALESGRLDDVVTVDVDSEAMPASTVMGLRPGDQFTLRDLLYGLMLPSGNDAALAIGRHLAGSDSAFVWQMNQLAWRLGLQQTSFENPHGLGGPNHAISAHDLAVLTRYAMSVPGFAEVVRTPAWVANGSRKLAFNNINSFLFNYPGADGIKTGWTRRAGPTLVASAVRDGRRVIVVVLNAEHRDYDAHALMNWAFSSFDWSGVTPLSPPPTEATVNRFG